MEGVLVRVQPTAECGRETGGDGAEGIDGGYLLGVDDCLRRASVRGEVRSRSGGSDRAGCRRHRGAAGVEDFPPATSSRWHLSAEREDGSVAAGNNRRARGDGLDCL